MRTFLFFGAFLLSGCAYYNQIPDDKLPVYYQSGVDSDLLIFKTDDIRVADVKEKRISYEYNDRNITLSQLGEHAKRFCAGRGRDTVLTDMRLTNRHNFRRATFECKETPILIPGGGYPPKEY